MEECRRILFTILLSVLSLGCTTGFVNQERVKLDTNGKLTEELYTYVINVDKLITWVFEK